MKQFDDFVFTTGMSVTYDIPSYYSIAIHPNLAPKSTSFTQNYEHYKQSYANHICLADPHHLLKHSSHSLPDKGCMECLEIVRLEFHYSIPHASTISRLQLPPVRL